uniref:Uncharacterized protein n=1 Tax=Romanomermis culicivorax TaxID=13658 RepID=A0A915J2Z9_ROMCU
MDSTTKYDAETVFQKRSSSDAVCSPSCRTRKKLYCVKSQELDDFKIHMITLMVVTIIFVFWIILYVGLTKLGFRVDRNSRRTADGVQKSDLPPELLCYLAFSRYHPDLVNIMNMQIRHKRFLALPYL